MPFSGEVQVVFRVRQERGPGSLTTDGAGENLGPKAGAKACGPKFEHLARRTGFRGSLLLSRDFFSRVVPRRCSSRVVPRDFSREFLEFVVRLVLTDSGSGLGSGATDPGVRAVPEARVRGVPDGSSKKADATKVAVHPTLSKLTGERTEPRLPHFWKVGNSRS